MFPNQIKYSLRTYSSAIYCNTALEMHIFQQTCKLSIDPGKPSLDVRHGFQTVRISGISTGHPHDVESVGLAIPVVKAQAIRQPRSTVDHILANAAIALAETMAEGAESTYIWILLVGALQIRLKLLIDKMDGRVMHDDITPTSIDVNFHHEMLRGDSLTRHAQRGKGT